MSQIVLVDMGSIFHPLWHTTASESEQNPNAMSQQVVAKIRALASGQPHVALALDSRKSFRKELDASYKASRESKSEAFFHQCRLALETLRADGFPTWEAEGFEADDIIASAASRVPDNAPLDPDVSGVLIVSSDKDLLQLICGNKHAKNPASGNILDVAGVVEKFGVQPHQILDWLTLVGDASDGVQGVRGIGAKGAAAILNTFGNLDDCYTAMDNGEAKLKPAAFAALNEFRQRLSLTRQLLTLRTDAPIAFEEIFKERVPADVAIFGADDEPMQDINEAMPTRYELDERSKQTRELVETIVAMPTLEDYANSGSAAGRTETESSQAPSPDAGSHGPGILDSGGPSQVQSPGRGMGATGTTSATEQGSRQSPVSHQAPAQGNGNPAVESARSAVSRGMESGTAISAADEAGVSRLPANGTERPSAAIVVASPVEFERRLEPSSMVEAKQLATDMFTSRIFSQFGHPAAVLAVILSGRELGMGAMASLRGFFIVEGKPTLSSDLIRALVIKSGKATFFRPVERTATRCTWETKRGDDPPVSLSFSIEDAQQAGLIKKGSGWEKAPADMLSARASAKLARLIYADVVFNLYDPSELES